MKRLTRDKIVYRLDQAESYATRIVSIEDDTVRFNDRISFPVRPMVGVIGTAPAGEGIETHYPGPHGGNMDNRYVTTGATVHLPVSVPGAMLGVGDVHASMGDGEISMIGLDLHHGISGRNTASARLAR